MNNELIIKVLDTLALALAEHNHQWSDKERELYESAIADIS